MSCHFHNAPKTSRAYMYSVHSIVIASQYNNWKRIRQCNKPNENDSE